jgi:tRNA A-37 threonylcarbamoyl transferase component Bud32
LFIGALSLQKAPSRKKLIPEQDKIFKRPQAVEIPLQRVIIFSLAAVLFLGVIGLWTRHAVRESLHKTLTEKLQTILDADLTALEIWMEDQMHEIKSWARQPDLREQVQALVEIGRDPLSTREKLLRSPYQADLQENLSSELLEERYLGFGVIDRTGLILASDQKSELAGRRLSPFGMALLTEVFQDKVLIRKPFPKRALVADLVPELNEPMMITAAPVRDQKDTIVAVLMFGINPELDFTRILSVARVGESGDTYAFDDKGFLISDSRFEEQLKEIGIIDDAPDARSILNVQIRDPGGDLTRGYRTETPAAARPLTRMAAAAIAGESGIDLEGYRDYRGVRVIGAWRWLPKYGFGVATEVTVEEAFGILSAARRAAWGLFALLAVSAGAILFSVLRIHRLKNRIHEVRQLGQYTLEEKIGEGGMGKVYKARHAMLKRPTAVKLLKPEAVTQEAIDRFEREVQLTSRLTHPNTVEIYDYGRTPEGIFYYAMEYLPGVTLSRLIEMDGAIPPARVVHILKHICYSLEEAHGMGLIHRDIKPLNVILCNRGAQFDVVKVLDFGLVKDIGSQHDVHLTAAQEVTGTPAYVAPERFTDPRNIDARSDLYSLGSVGFNLLTGQDVFEGPNAMEICYHVMKTPPPHPGDLIEHEIPGELDQLIFGCLSKDPAQRPQNAGAMIEALNSIHEAGPWEQKDAQLWWEKNAERVQTI